MFGELFRPLRRPPPAPPPFLALSRSLTLTRSMIPVRPARSEAVLPAGYQPCASYVGVRVKRAEGGRKPGSVAVGCIQLSGSLPCTRCGWTSFHRAHLLGSCRLCGPPIPGLPPVLAGVVAPGLRSVLRHRAFPCHTCWEPGLSSFRPALQAFGSKADSHATLSLSFCIICSYHASRRIGRSSHT